MIKPNNFIRIPLEKTQTRMEKIAILHEKLKHLYEEKYGSKYLLKALDHLLHSKSESKINKRL